MTSIIYIGLDVHTTNYTICAYTLNTQRPFAQTTIHPDIRELIKYLDRLNRELGGECQFVCGYEAGCLGYSLYRQLRARNCECVILAPTTMPSSPNERIKTDKRDAAKIARCLAYGTYSAVHVPAAQDDAVKEFIRMRDDAKTLLKQTKQQIVALCARHGRRFDGKNNWTLRHLEWLRTLKLGEPVLQETLDEYLVTLGQLSEKLERLDRRINELAQRDSYVENVRKLGCFRGIAAHTALSFLTEIGDFQRFPTAQQFAAFLGLVPGEHSSGDCQRRTGITKSGNGHLRRLLIEAAQSFGRGAPGKKSKALKARQLENPPEVIAYADRANDRLRRKYIRIALRSRANIAKTAVARELACFIWGMMNNRLVQP